MDKFLLAVSFLLMLGGCSVTKERVDPYAGLLPTGYQQTKSNITSINKADLQKSKVFVVTGANFEHYSETWNVFDKQIKSGSVSDLVYSRAELERMQSSWSPALATNNLVLTLKNVFGEVQIVEDLATAKSNQANWIVMFDHAFEQPSTASATWTTTTQIDLLDGSLNLVASSRSSSKHSHGIAWGSADVMRLSVQRGTDIKNSIDEAMGKFRLSLESLTSKR